MATTSSSKRKWFVAGMQVILATIWLVMTFLDERRRIERYAEARDRELQRREAQARRDREIIKNAQHFNVWCVRHAEPDPMTGVHLTDAGKDQSNEAGQVRILSSPAPRAFKTAAIIGELHGEEPIKCEWLGNRGNPTTFVISLLLECMAYPDHAIVVVSHQDPLVHLVGKERTLDYGQVSGGKVTVYK